MVPLFGDILYHAAPAPQIHPAFQVYNSRNRGRWRALSVSLLLPSSPFCPLLRLFKILTPGCWHRLLLSYCSTFRLPAGLPERNPVKEWGHSMAVFTDQFIGNCPGLPCVKHKKKRRCTNNPLKHLK